MSPTQESPPLHPPTASAQGGVGDLLRRAASAYADREFAVFPSRSWTYQAFDAWVDRVAAGLQAHGVAQGAKVAIMLPNCGEFLATWFACARIGAVEVPVNTSFRGHLLKHVLNHSEAQLLVIDAQLLGQLDAVAGELIGLRTVIVCNGEAAAPRLPFAVLEAHGSTPRPCAIEARDPLAIVFTSGTTGPSKGALLSHKYFAWFAERSCELRGMEPQERLYTCLPLFHANAQVLTGMAALVRGQTAIFDTHFTASGFWDRMRDFGATQFNYIGGIVPILMKQPRSPRDRQHRVRLAMGAAAPKDLWRAFEERFGLRLLECYGQTEDCAVTCNPLDDTRVGSIGKAMWGYEMQVVDDAGHPVPDGTLGEFVVRPGEPDVFMLGYYRMPEETLQVQRDLWFHTGDLGSRDADGYFWFMDRKKDALRRRGENISAWEVELVVNEHPAVLECAVYGVPSAVGEDDVMVAAVLKPGRQLAPLELVQHCERRLAYFAVPRYIDFRAELPKTPTHRVEKYRLRQQGVTPTTWDCEQAGYRIQRH